MGLVLQIVLVIIVIHVSVVYNWRQDRRPRVMGDKIPFKAIFPNNRRIQRRIVRYHNSFRTRVIPKAANMLRMKWHKGASHAAQRWAQECLFLVHDNITGRHIDNYGSCGQNIFIATKKVPWLFAIKSWFLERDNFTYGGTNNNLHVVGHYTQMVWATTHEVGCGLSYCRLQDTEKTFYNYVCNYCPIGNKPGQLGKPYRRGRPCGMCRKNCHAKRLCTNTCHAADLWVNCKDLYKGWPLWLCSTDTPKGRERSKNCRATCTCKNKLHD
ncbi:cysteine-rich secretory protein 2-like [Zophobas morio]|uniref:cysteine-rich secretory protein 2-like n=1 Tax=Zophobas morio TaxID=2755281 RepID=UPI003082917E